MGMDDQEQLIQLMKRKRMLNSRIIEEAFRNIDRSDFVPAGMQMYRYEDIPLPIGGGQTISQPSTVAFMLELLDVHAGQEILDIGCGSGYTTALLSYLTGKEGKVWGIERISELLITASENLSGYNKDNYEILSAGVELGIPGRSFDRILVSAAARVFPAGLLDQLNKSGKIVIPIRESVYLYEKTGSGEILSKEYYGFSFVPLIM